MHIAFLSVPGGGLDTNVRVLAPTLVQLGHRVSILYIHSSEKASPAATHCDDGLSVFHATLGNWHYYVYRATFARTALPLLVRAYEYAQALAKTVEGVHQREGLDLVELPEISLLPRSMQKVPYIIRLHSAAWTWRRMLDEPSPWSDSAEAWLEGVALRGAAGISAPCTFTTDYITKVCRVDKPVEIIPYPVDTIQFKPNGGRANPPLILFVGRVEQRKGASVLMRAIPVIRDHHPDCEFVFAGFVSDELREQVATMPNGVQFLGVQPRERLVQWYQRAAVFVAPSLWDNSPNTVYEAMACGTPVVATRVGGIPELVDDGVTGLLVPPGDPAVLADAIGSLLGDTTRREQMGQRARDKVVAEYSVDKIAARTMTFYARVLSG